MKRRRHAQPGASRRGVILLVVLSLLALFLVVGLSFVSYADSELSAARSGRDGQTFYQPDLEPEQAFAYFMKQLIYDNPDDETGVYSALRGHSLARNMYGFNYDIAANNAIVPGINATPHNGLGRLYVTSPISGVNEHDLISYMYFPADNLGLHDPERYGGPTYPNSAWRPSIRNAATGAPTPRASFTGGFNAPYTYPDLNTLMLAAIDNSGNVMQISGHRDYLWGGALNDTTNPNWTNVQGKYMTLRPRPFDNPPVQVMVNGALVTKPGFPYPEDVWGDVQNLIGGPGGNDSIWIDIGAPVMTLPDGRKYKMLVAPLIMDLDNRINLNVHGNVRGQNGVHLSNQGWGKWEINPTLVMLGNPNEYKNLFLGNSANGMTGRGRYGADLNPSSSGLFAPSGKTSPFYSPGDIDGCYNYNYPLNTAVATGKLQLPFFTPLLPLNMSPPNDPSVPYTCFPMFPLGYDGGFGTERMNHPALYNYFFPQGDDRVFGASHMEAILRYGGTNSPGLNSDLYRLLPTNMANATARRLVTTQSFDHARPGVSPYVWNPADAATKYTWVKTNPYPAGTAPIAFPLSQAGVTRTTVPPTGSDFDPLTWRAEPSTFRAIAGVLHRVDLDRKLADYPPLDGNGSITDSAKYAEAVAERQAFAMDIFNALLAATGCQDPNGAVPPTGADLDAALWLAQLAVNIVDFIDNDDYMTPFNWVTKDPTKWVFGTELPRVVVNEWYIEYVVNPANATQYNVNTFIELHNTARAQTTTGYSTYPPLPNGPALSDDGKARLQVSPAGGAAYPAYQVVLANRPANYPTPGQPGAQKVLTVPQNTTGDPNFGTPPTSNVVTQVTTYGATADQSIVLPAYGKFSDATATNNGFFVMGPLATAGSPAGGAFTPAPHFTTASLTYTVPKTTTPLLAPSIMLRRLACPALPPNPAVGGTYTGIPNPYVTTDYVEDPGTGTVDDSSVNNAVLVPVALRKSWGRNQPYAADGSQRVPTALKTPLVGQPQHTFYSHNASTAPTPPTATDTMLKQPFDWLVHLDRQLVSPMELLQVSGQGKVVTIGGATTSSPGRPFDLTQRFMTSTDKFGHRAPWFDQNTRLHRFFEFVENGDKAAGCTAGGRVPGKININTVWPDVPGGTYSSVFRALCDAQTSNNFTQAQVDAIFQNLANYRTPMGVLNAANQPFLGMAAGYSKGTLGSPPDLQYPQGNGIERTLLGSQQHLGIINDNFPLGQRMLQVPETNVADPQQYHPYQRDALLTKIFSNLTTRSNVFAVWMTVGFFEVNQDTDPTTGLPIRPVKLGAELYRTENRQVRHRMFAIVDRSAMTWFNTTAQTAVAIPAGKNSAQVTVTIPAGAPIDPRTGRAWTIVPGMVLNVDYGGVSTDQNTGQQAYAEENVVVLATPPPVAPTAATPGSFTAVFTKQHVLGSAGVPNAIPVKCYGNPGPWTRYDPRQDNQVVPYFSMID